MCENKLKFLGVSCVYGGLRHDPEAEIGTFVIGVAALTVGRTTTLGFMLPAAAMAHMPRA